MTGEVWQRYQYDAAGRLACTKDDSSVLLADYTYGASNQRLKQTEYGSGGVTCYYAWDGNSIIAEFSDTGSALSWTKSYVFLGGRLLATPTPGGTNYHHPDRLGTRLVTTETGGLVGAEQTTLPYGTALDAESTGTPTNRRFTSYDRSQKTKLDYAVNRFYNACQGRFTQVDPIGMSAASLDGPQSLNLYAYVGNDPINRADPDGLFWKKLFGWIGKAFKWVAIALMVAVAVLLIIPAPWAGTALGKIAVFFMKHKWLSALIGGGNTLNFLTPGIGGINSFVSGDGSGGSKTSWSDWAQTEGLEMLTNFAAGFGDTISFGITRKIRRRMGTDNEVNPCSGAYSVGEWSGVAWGVATGGAGGAARGGIKGLIRPAGTQEWSHAIPDRIGKVNSVLKRITESPLNGNYRTIRDHALNDPYRYRTMPSAWKQANPINPTWQRLLDRTPDWVKGAATGGAVTGASKANGGC